MNISEIKKALEFARNAHHGQLRAIGPDAGKPYFDTHVMRVVRAVPDFAKPAAALHDVLEDTPTIEVDLIGAGFSKETIQAVRTLTHYGDKYSRYIDDLVESGDSIALTVKAADLMDNLSSYPEGSNRPRYLRALHQITGRLLSLAPED